MKNEFVIARVKLTFWYILISACLLAVFSLASIQAERLAFSRIEQALANPIQRPKLTLLLETRIEEFDEQFTIRLLYFDLILLGIASVASFILSGITLAPIQKMMKEQEEFAADASHELRTPLTTINMEIEAFQRTEKDLPVRFSQMYDTVRDEVSRMKKIIDGLLTLVREGSTTTIEKGRINVGNIVAELINQMQILAKEKNIRFNSEIDTECYIRTNREEVRRVILILLDNAIKYSDEKGEVNVFVNKNNNKIYITVSNTGKGIAKEDLQHIFKRFYRGSHSKGKKGAGLGLAIAKKIIEKYKGTIHAESEVNKRTKFTIQFPAS